MTNITLTDGEKRLLRELMDDGFFFDDLRDDEYNTFVTWGPLNVGKEDRARLSTMVQKGIISINDQGTRDEYVQTNIFKSELMKLAEHPDYQEFLEKGYFN